VFCYERVERWNDAQSRERARPCSVCSLGKVRMECRCAIKGRTVRQLVLFARQRILEASPRGVEHGVTLYRTQESIFLYEEKKPRKLTWKPARRLNCGLTPGAANDACEHHMHYMHVVPIWKKGHKAAFTRLRVALLHALFSGAGE
jgi:hypothetical protein